MTEVKSTSGYEDPDVKTDQYESHLPLSFFFRTNLIGFIERGFYLDSSKSKGRGYLSLDLGNPFSISVTVVL